MMRGEELLFAVAVCLKGAVVWEWGNVSRAIYRLQIRKVLLRLAGSIKGLMCGFVAFGRRMLLGGRIYERERRSSRRQLGVQFLGVGLCDINGWPGMIKVGERRRL
jgi:hypothetical protein